MSLSLYYPTRNELVEISQGAGLSYRLRVCQGWMASPDNAQTPDGQEVRGSALRRKTVRMFAEGSLLRSPHGETCLGDLARVTPNVFKQAHTVYRYGWTLAVGYRGQKEVADG